MKLTSLWKGGNQSLSSSLGKQPMCSSEMFKKKIEEEI